MTQEPRLGISIKYESRTIFRNVRPVNDIIAEFEEKKIPHLPIDPEHMRYGNWEIVVAFARQESCDRLKNGEIKFQTDWLGSGQPQKKSVNPLKASKRAHGG